MKRTEPYDLKCLMFHFCEVGKKMDEKMLISSRQETAISDLSED